MLIPKNCNLNSVLIIFFIFTFVCALGAFRLPTNPLDDVTKQQRFRQPLNIEGDEGLLESILSMQRPQA